MGTLVMVATNTLRSVAKRYDKISHCSMVLLVLLVSLVGKLGAAPHISDPFYLLFQIFKSFIYSSCIIFYLTCWTSQNQSELQPKKPSQFNVASFHLIGLGGLFSALGGMEGLQLRRNLSVNLVQDFATVAKEVGHFKGDKERGENKGLHEVVEERGRAALKHAVANELDHPAHYKEQPGDAVPGALERRELERRRHEDQERGQAEFHVKEGVKDAVAEGAKRANVDLRIGREAWQREPGEECERRKENCWHENNVNEDIGGVMMIFAVKSKLFLEIENTAFTTAAQGGGRRSGGIGHILFYISVYIYFVLILFCEGFSSGRCRNRSE